MYFLYVLKSLETEHYYVGVSCDTWNRMYQHYTIIKKIVYHLRKNPNKKIAFQYSPIHLILAKQAKIKVENIKRPETIIKRCYSFEVVNESETKKGIAEMESDLLYKGRNDKFMLNSQKISRYCKHMHPAMVIHNESYEARKAIMMPQWVKEHAETYLNNPKIKFK